MRALCSDSTPAQRHLSSVVRHSRGVFGAEPGGKRNTHKEVQKGGRMYIGIGTLLLIVILIVLLA
jgi:hypothetical protein